jgi:phytoene synthase
VAGVVGLMMCHVLRIEDDRALRHAAHLGIALQLTNICRDIAEDWQLGRLYVPESVLSDAGASQLRSELGGPLPHAAQAPLSRAVERLLALADSFYRSADRGLAALPWRGAFAVRTARLVYARIGGRLRARRHDVLAGRVVVPGYEKLAMLARSAGISLWELRARRAHTRHSLPERVLSFPHDVLPLAAPASLAVPASLAAPASLARSR